MTDEDRRYVRQLMRDRPRLDKVIQAAYDGDLEAHAIIVCCTEEFNLGAPCCDEKGRLGRLV